jgi:predicted PP-loop superfamily ATPase
MSIERLQRRRDHDVVFLGDRVADEIMRIDAAASALEVDVPALRLTADEAATTHVQHTKGSSYGCPVCEAQKQARTSPPASGA